MKHTVESPEMADPPVLLDLVEVAAMAAERGCDVSLRQLRTMHEAGVLVPARQSGGGRGRPNLYAPDAVDIAVGMSCAYEAVKPTRRAVLIAYGRGIPVGDIALRRAYRECYLDERKKFLVRASGGRPRIEPPGEPTAEISVALSEIPPERLQQVMDCYNDAMTGVAPTPRALVSVLEMLPVLSAAIFPIRDVLLGTAPSAPTEPTQLGYLQRSPNSVAEPMPGSWRMAEGWDFVGAAAKAATATRDDLDLARDLAAVFAQRVVVNANHWADYRTALAGPALLVLRDDSGMPLDLLADLMT